VHSLHYIAQPFITTPDLAAPLHPSFGYFERSQQA
jgi:hypothetical protein